VAIFQDTAVVGTQDFSGGPGAAYIFERNNGGPNQWEETAKLGALDGAPGDNFGIDVAIFGDTAVIGAFRDDTNGEDSGAAYVFSRNEGGANAWGQVSKLLALDGAAKDDFGLSVAVSSTTAVVGSPEHNANGLDSGSAYTFSQALLEGDTFPLDDRISLHDLNNVHNHFGDAGPADGTLAGDAYPFDGQVNVDDLNAVLNNFGVTAAAAPVPEPAAGVVYALGMGVMLVDRRRRRCRSYFRQ